MRPNQPNELVKYIESHGYLIGNPSALDGITVDRDTPPLSAFLNLSCEIEPISTLPEKYNTLKSFVDHVIIEQQRQLKPLLFAFFFHTTIKIHVAGDSHLSRQFFDEHRKEHHLFQETNISHLESFISSSYQPNNPQFRSLLKTSFSASMTEVTYNSLVAFLSDNSFSFFLYVLSEFLQINTIPYSSRPDLVPEFIFQMTDKTTATVNVDPRFELLSESIEERAKKIAGAANKLNIYDCEPANMSSSYPLPGLFVERILAAASDAIHMVNLTKNALPSCAYFTFPAQHNAYAINSEGTLIAAALERSYTKLISTSIDVDLDDLPFFSSVTSGNTPAFPSAPVHHLLVPRQANRTGSYFTRTLIGPSAYCLAFSPDSRLLLAGCNNEIRLWTCETTGALAHIPTSSGVTWCCDWSPFGYHFVVGTDDNTATMWGIDSITPIRMFAGHSQPMTDIAFHQNANTIATCSYDRSVRLWDVASGASARVFAESTEVPMVSRFTRNGKILVVGDASGNLTMWNIGENRKIGRVQGHKGAIRDLSFSVEGTLMASVGDGGEVHIWDAATLCSSTANVAEPLKKFQPKYASTHIARFSSRNLLMAIGSVKE